MPSCAVEPSQQRLEPRRLDMEPEARPCPHEQTARPGEEDGGRGRVGGKIGRSPLHQRKRRVGAVDVDRGPAVVDARRAPAFPPPVRRAERLRSDEQRAVAGDAQRMRALGRQRIEPEDRRARSERCDRRVDIARDQRRAAPGKRPRLSSAASRPESPPRAAPAASSSHAWSRFPSGSSATGDPIVARRSAPR